MQTKAPLDAVIAAERIVGTIQGRDMPDLCDATESEIKNGGGFGWIDMPARDILERYWQGVVTVPSRHLFVGRVDGMIAGTGQLVQPPSNNQAQSFSASITTFFVSPWARGRGVGMKILAEIEAFAHQHKIEVLNLDVRVTQEDGLRLFERAGFTRWATNPLYAKVHGQVIAGHYYHKHLVSGGA
jgi:ribosomal protein S18 acetylase RimI-like enzyme